MATTALPSPVAKTAPSVALLGNPNTGKSTLFNALAGARQRVGNYPGCTVEKKTGQMQHEDQRIELVDLPGTYSLAPRSPDEMVAVDVLLGRRGDTRRPDALLCIVDASNLERNLYLVSQALELGLPTVLALNMVDVARERGLTIDVPRLSKQLGLPIIELQAHKRVGVDELKQALTRAVSQPSTAAPSRESPFPPEFQNEVRQLEAELAKSDVKIPRYLVERMLLDTTGYLQGMIKHSAQGHEALENSLAAARSRLATAGMPVPAVEAMSRYAWVGRVLEGVVSRPSTRRVTASDKIDRVLTHKFLGTAVFALVMIVIFQSVFSWANSPFLPLMDWIDGGVGWVADLVKASMPEGPLRSLITDGIIAGVGMVIIFLPQIMILFFFIGILEDCGYMARAAYLMDKLMAGVGLSGKSFIPMLSSFACAIPGVMATRVIENPRDRLTTILVAPLMSCSARLPVYVLMIGAFIPPITYLGFISLRGLTFVAMYLVGIVAAVFVALILKKTILKGETPPFVMELPSYKWPSASTVIFRMVDRGWSFVRRAGTLILVISVVVWWASYYPRDASLLDPAKVARAEVLSEELKPLEEQHQADTEELAAKYAELEALAKGEQPEPPVPEVGAEASGESPIEDPPELDGIGFIREQKRVLAEIDVLLGRMQASGYVERSEELAGIENEFAGTYVRNSYLGKFGQAIEPVVRPLGWDWRLGAAAVASFPAREVVVATLGVIYNLGGDQDEASRSLRSTLKEARWDPGSEREGQKVYSVPVALSLMVFFALCAQCGATLAVIKRETNSWWWPLFTFVYMTGLAYVAALLTYQIGSRIGG